MHRRAVARAESAAGGHRGKWLFAALVTVGAVAFLLAAGVFAGRGEAQAAPGGFLASEGTPPPGANNPRCRPSKRHPYPVVLVHGTFETMEQNWAVFSPRLKARGYCVYALNYGGRGMGPIQDSARELDVFVNRVLRLTGARKVQLVGHSQGGMMPRYWIKNLGGAPLVEDLIGFAPSNYGTEIPLATNPPGGPCPACQQQRAGSRFLNRLNSGDDTPGPGSYTVIATSRFDDTIIPYTRCFLKSQRRTANLTLQRYNGGLVVTHQNIYNDPYAQALAFEALANPGPADPSNAPFPT